MTFWTGEVNIRSYWDNFGTKQGVVLGQEKLILGHNKKNYGMKQCDFLGQEKLILGLIETNFRTG